MYVCDDFVKRARVFRSYFRRDSLTLRPCAYDALSAILIEKAGFEVVGTSGYGISASIIGQPDIGLVGYGEMVERVRTMINAVSLPVDVDADTGYGNALNVYWTVKNFAGIGAAGIRIEDQVWPKRCGHMAGKQIIPTEEMVRKIKAAVKAREETNPFLVIGARTDARSVYGFEEVLERGKAYADAGADYIYVEAPQSLKEVEILVKEIPVPISFNIIPGGMTPPFTLKELEEAGVKYLSVPMVCLYPAVKAIIQALDLLKEGKIKEIAEMGVDWSQFNEIVGLNFWRSLEKELLSSKELMEKYGSHDVEKISERERQEAEAKWRK